MISDSTIKVFFVYLKEGAGDTPRLRSVAKVQTATKELAVEEALKLAAEKGNVSPTVLLVEDEETLELFWNNFLDPNQSLVCHWSPA